MKRVISIIGILLAVGVNAQNISRQEWNDGWRFCKGDDAAYASATFDDSAWRELSVPHDWGVEQPFVQSNPGETGKLQWWGTAWYRKHLQLDEAGAYVLDFGGVMSGSTVYVNGIPAGGRPYGYSSFRVEMGPYLHEGDNVIAVRVDNKPNSSRWYPGGGIYRPVHLTRETAVGVRETYVTVDEINDKGTATVTVRTVIRGSGDVDVKSTIELPGRPFFGTGTEAIEKRLTVKDAREGTVAVQVFKVPGAKLWTPETPELQTITTRVTDISTGVSESYATTIGIRTASWTEEGFFLNGEKTFLKGVCLHHDAGALGAVWNESVWVRRLGQLKEMGCNAIRCTHNPPAQEFLDLCDRMGFLVIDELTDTWTIAKKPNGYAAIFDEWVERDLVDMIHRDRNHPCVIAWSIGNECAEQGYSDKWDIPARLTDICHREDPTRPTTAGNDNLWASTQPYRHTIDVYGFNYKPHAYKDFHEANPTKPYYGSETASCISSRGFYVFPVSDEKGAGWPEGAPYQVSSYDLYAPYWASCPDYEWKFEDENPSCAGEFVWTGFDYLGEPTPYNFDPTVLTNFHDEAARKAAEKELEEMSRNAPPSRSSYFGIFDLAGFPKDRYWLYKSRWCPDEPTAHILPHWTWPGREGQVTPVHVYTSGDSAELFVNGKSQGIRKRGDKEYRLRWDSVVYEPGEVMVVTYRDGSEWARDTVRTAGAPAALKLSAENVGGTVFVTVKVVDKDGLFVPTASNTVTFSLDGPAELLATDAGDATSHVSFSSPSLPAFSGMASALVRLRRPHLKPGKHAVPARPTTITVTSPGLKEDSIIVR